MPASPKDIVVLRQVRFFANLSVMDLDELVGAMKTRHLVTRENLFQQDEMGDSLFILTEGLLSVQARSSAGLPLEIGVIRPGQVVGEMACVDPAPRSATVVACQNSVLLELNRDAMRLFQQKRPVIATSLVGGVIDQVTARIRDADRKLAESAERMVRRTLSRKGSPLAQAGHSFAAPAARVGPRPRFFPGKIDLSAIPGLIGLAPGEIDLLMSQSPPMLYPPESDLCREGDPGNSCFLIVRGQVEILKDLVGGRKCLATLGPGSFVGQMALVDAAPRAATVRAREDVLALEMTRKVFQAMLASSNSLAIRFQEQVAVAGIRQLRSADMRLTGVLESEQRAGSDSEYEASVGRYSHFRAALSEWSLHVPEDPLQAQAQAPQQRAPIPRA